MRFLPFLMLVVPPAVATVVGTNDLSLKDVASARQIYVAKCAKCHRFYEPMQYSPDDWRLWMRKMVQKSKLNSQKADLLNQYLDAYRAGRLVRKPEAKTTPLGR
jgi:hypothetical protein